MHHIILSSFLFGSFYIFSISLKLTNKMLLEDKKKISNELFIINSLTMLVSGSIIVYNYSLFNSLYIKSLRM